MKFSRLGTLIAVQLKGAIALVPELARFAPGDAAAIVDTLEQDLALLRGAGLPRLTSKLPPTSRPAAPKSITHGGSDADDILPTIQAHLARCSVDELRVVGQILGRLEIGRARYGDLALASDTRNWAKELGEELLDVLAYAAIVRLSEKST